MMGAAEANHSQNVNGIGGEVAIGEKEKLDEFDEGLASLGHELEIYVSHIDIF
jgi:hypothetical protein